ncbi:MAG: 50S ribosomal protein L29 [Weeksellaceae bacterium]|jgi:large subunit ribosomal protein L29
MKAADIRELSTEDLIGKIEDEKANYFKLVMGHKVSHVENPLAIKKLRKDIARMLTILKERTTQQ